MKSRAIVVASSLAALLGSACNKQPASDGAATVALEGLPGVEARLPEGTRVSPNAMGIGVMLKGPGVSMTIGPEIDVDAPTLAAARENAAGYAPTNLSSESLADGYILTYENGGGGEARNFWLVGRRQFADSAYSCGVRSPKKEHQQSGIAICKSLTK